MLSRKRSKRCAGLILAAALLFCPAVFAQEYTFQEAEAKAKEFKDLSQSDIIYSQESTKALYYQNLQVIQLLSEIRDEIANVRKDLEKIKVKTEGAMPEGGM